MARILALLFGVACYVVFFVTFLYSIGFVGNLPVPKAIDTGTAGPFLPALLINAVLLGIFAVQHSVMARPGFKKWWTRIVPHPVERSTYVLLSSLALILLFAYWQPMPAPIWSVQSEAARYALWGVFWLGWVIVLTGTFLISHFDLFGLRQVYFFLKNREYKHFEFRTPFLYKLVRHPIMLGFILAFWAAPDMSVGHLVFSIATTVYILIALQLEERDLVTYHGAAYTEYQQQVSMILPVPKRK